LNTKKGQILKLAALVAWVLATVGCPQDKQRTLIGPEVNADLIIYFNRGATEEQVNTFLGAGTFKTGTEW
jgi:hypothetical protein